MNQTRIFNVFYFSSTYVCTSLLINVLVISRLIMIAQYIYTYIFRTINSFHLVNHGVVNFLHFLLFGSNKRYAFFLPKTLRQFLSLGNFFRAQDLSA